MSCTLLLICSLNFNLDVGITDIDHHWEGDGIRHTHYKTTNKSFGITAWHPSNFGLRVAYGQGNKVQATGYYNNLSIDFESITSFEVLYRYQLTEDFTAFIGAGQYLIPLPLYSDDKLIRNDSDDDHGFLIGITYNMNDKFSISYRYTHYSQIDKEYLRGNGLHLEYKF